MYEVDSSTMESYFIALSNFILKSEDEKAKELDKKSMGIILQH